MVQEMLAGRVSACFCSFAAVQAHVKNGNLRLLGVTGVARSQLAPAVPTLQESGLDGYGAGAWYGVIAPAKTPHPIVARIASELDAVMGEREVRDRLLAAGLTPLRDSPEALATAIRSESIQWQVILRQTGGPTNPRWRQVWRRHTSNVMKQLFAIHGCGLRHTGAAAAR
ncbi:tripartite tricarboxylate transporter substrate-binding protein [Cupriavidus basilensis]